MAAAQVEIARAHALITEVAEIIKRYRTHIGFTSPPADAALPVEQPDRGTVGDLSRNGEVRSVVSGVDEDSAEVWRLLKAARMRSTFEPMITNHVEMKVAARVVRHGMRHTEVVINNLLCRGRGPNYRKTFTGGRKR